MSKNRNKVKLRYLGVSIPDFVMKVISPYLLESALASSKQELALNILPKMLELGVDLDCELPSFRDNRNALYTSSRNGLYKVLEYLLSHGVSPHVVIDYYRSTALHVAAFNGHKDCVELLLSTDGIEPSRTHKNRYGSTYLDEAKY